MNSTHVECVIDSPKQIRKFEARISSECQSESIIKLIWQYDDVLITLLLALFLFKSVLEVVIYIIGCYEIMHISALAFNMTCEHSFKYSTTRHIFSVSNRNIVNRIVQRK